MVEGRNPARIEHWAKRIAEVVRGAG